jgi:hypothetical protein
MSYFLAFVVLAIGGLMFRKMLHVALFLIVFALAVAVASFVTFWSSVLFLSRVDAVLVGGTGVIEGPACILLWLTVFIMIFSLRPSKIFHVRRRNKNLQSD